MAKDTSSGNQGSVKDPEHDGRLKENREAGVTKGTTEASAKRTGASGHKGESSHKGEAKASSHKGEASHKGDTTHKSESSHKGESKAASHKGESSHKGEGGNKGDESADLKSREYKDAEGNIHHHTRTYGEQHKGDK